MNIESFRAKPKFEYCADSDIEQLAKTITEAIANAGESEPEFGDIAIEKMRKKATWVMLASLNNPELRHRPGNMLRTYTGVRNEDGTLKDETYKGDSTVREGDIILRNRRGGTDGQLVYPSDTSDPSLRGFPIKVRYEADGTAVEDINGEDVYEEYKSGDHENFKKKYDGAEPTEGKWQIVGSRIPSYIVEIPQDKGEVDIKTKDATIAVRGGDFIVIDDLGNGKTRVQGIEKGAKNDTYGAW